MAQMRSEGGSNDVRIQNGGDDAMSPGVMKYSVNVKVNMVLNVHSNHKAY